MIDRGSGSRARSMVISSFNIDSKFEKGESEFVMLNEKGMETDLNVISKKS